MVLWIWGLSSNDYRKWKSCWGKSSVCWVDKAFAWVDKQLSKRKKRRKPEKKSGKKEKLKNPCHLSSTWDYSIFLPTKQEQWFPALLNQTTIKDVLVRCKSKINFPSSPQTQVSASQHSKFLLPWLLFLQPRWSVASRTQAWATSLLTKLRGVQSISFLCGDTGIPPFSLD